MTGISNLADERLAVRLADHRAALREEVRRLCPDCRTSEQNGLTNGYTCPLHWPLLVGGQMPTIGEVAR